MRRLAISILSNGVLSALIGAIAGSGVTVGLTYFTDQRLQLAEYQLREISEMQYREFDNPNGFIFHDIATLTRAAVLMPAEVLSANASSTKHYCYNQLSEDCIKQFVLSVQALRKAIGTDEVSDEVIETYVRAAQRKLAELPDTVPRYTKPIPKSDLPAQLKEQ
ncbi:hypothetical protein [Thalassospira xiamenensis]|uniref:hypothetical protein n=1 Tax=Thalassospira xiamenensis TaxID=220697 RepID=UPI001FFE8960|nr:hypothetical protein [Thalassospira xiamenensis]MCK2168016.1 hypothetical protein [Thalassospira xiamenensis]